MFDAFSFADKTIQNNKDKMNQNSGVQKNWLDVIRRRDEKQGVEIAEHILQSYGVSKEDALKRAEQFFGIHF